MEQDCDAGKRKVIGVSGKTASEVGYGRLAHETRPTAPRLVCQMIHVAVAAIEIAATGYFAEKSIENGVAKSRKQSRWPAVGRPLLRHVLPQLHRASTTCGYASDTRDCTRE